MSNKYEWEETQDDDNLAKTGLGALVIGGLGLAAKMFLSSSQSKNNEQIKAQIDRKTDQYRSMDAKFFKSSKERDEMARLQKEIGDLKKKLK